MRRVGVDTNVLLRMFVTDDQEQHDTSKAFFAAAERDRMIVIGRLVIVEFFWTLRSRYKVPVGKILDAIGAMLERPDVEIEDADLVASALALARSGAGFSDALVAAANLRRGCGHTVTFDRHAAKTIPSMTLLA